MGKPEAKQEVKSLGQNPRAHANRSLGGAGIQT